jgi:hypothetical protein
MTEPNGTGPEVDDWLIGKFVALVEDLTDSLDLTAGVTEALQPVHFSNLAADLTEHLEIAAGLTAVFTGAVPVNELNYPMIASRRMRQSADSDLLVERTRSLLESVDAPARLQLRADPEYMSFRDSISLIAELDRVIHLTESIRHELLESGDGDGDGHVRTYSLARRVAQILSVGVTRDRDRDFYTTHDVDGNYRARVLARDRAFDLCSSLLASHSDHAGRGLSSRLADLLDAVHTARAGILDRSRTRAARLISGISTSQMDAQLASLGTLIELQELLDWMLSDFIGADVRGASLADVPLVGIRWSAATRWPTDWVERIRVASVEIAPEIFEITDDEGRRSRVAHFSSR